MIALQKDIFKGRTDDLPKNFLAQLDIMFARIFNRSETIPFTVREYIDTTNGSVSRMLPDGLTSPDKDYHFVKTDASGNTVTIYPAGTQTIKAAATLVLAARGDSAWLCFDSVSKSWWTV